MKREEEAFSKSISRYQNGIEGAILVTGERNCGKTNLCQYVLRKQFRNKQVFHIFPPVEGSTSVKAYERELGKVTGITREKSEIFASLQFGSVIVLHDMELWWERSPNGLELIKEIIKDIEQYSSSYLFVININIFAYELINNILDIQSKLIGVIQCQSFDSENLKALIMKRHNSSGLNFIIDNKSEESISLLKLARLFSKYFDCTRGNPGVTLNTWLSNITQYKNEQLTMNYPGNPETSIIAGLEEELLILLQQIILHKRMDKAKMKRVLLCSDDEIQRSLGPLILNGLVQEKTENVFVINQYVEPYVVRVLKNKDLL